MAGLQNLLPDCFKTETLFSIVRKFIFSILSVGPIPNHIAFILDGNRRLAAEKAMAATAKNDKAVLMICVAYTSTDEIVHAVQESYNEKKDDIRHHEIDKELPIKLADLEKHMYIAVAPDPDILVRTSGETRLSNFLLWQTTFCQLYSPNALWPEISLRNLEIEAIDCMVWAGLEYGYFQLYNYGCALVKSGAFSISVELGRTKWVHCSAIRGASAPEVEIGTFLLNTSSKYGAIDASKCSSFAHRDEIASSDAKCSNYT
ncbi:hypothetical protein GIB67_018691 [Kingdonia uniflora]|uniref:Uncharacterized protein n=1 Tax=Kingdonia uniflora TaxID=39325 RepID=A0A7J7L289_9MAGN|nr:hypothetical protein GIB67_018691 [Kingdonia uniflora]